MSVQSNSHVHFAHIALIEQCVHLLMQSLGMHPLEGCLLGKD
jgi:hypothetical protein